MINWATADAAAVGGKGTAKAAVAPPEAVEVTFTLDDQALNGQQLAVVGDFNDWDPHATPMVAQDERAYTATLDQPAGRYRFRYRPRTAGGSTTKPRTPTNQ
jgi:1,4-alpha-glucan branching enzyme